MKKADPNPKANRSILCLTYAVLAVMVGMMAYFGYFLQAQSEDVINNPYNKRLERFSERTLRGRILSADGQVLAETVVGEEGEELRVYPFGNLFAHVVGHSSKGKTGLEAQGDFYLLSTHVGLPEQILDEIAGRKDPGDDLVTTLDVGLQQVAYAALGDRKGAVVAIEPGTGKILAMVSKPDYDPNPFSLDTVWEEMLSAENDQAQLLNRATQGLYPPGSVFKIVTALEAMREDPAGYGAYHFDCSGLFTQDDYSIRCYQGAVHGAQDLGLAFANSCNGAFAKLGLGLDLGAMHDLAEQLLFNGDLPLPMAYSKSAYQMEAGAGEWEILQTAIGQGKTQVTPMHIAMITSAVANGGILMEPYLMDHVQDTTGEEVKKFLPKAYGSLMTAGESANLNGLMVRVVTEGTGSALRDASYPAAGKTGSAEFKQGRETHAWFTGFAPADDPKIVVTVVVEEGGSGGRAAAPIARAMFDQYLLR